MTTWQMRSGLHDVAGAVERFVEALGENYWNKVQCKSLILYMAWK